MKGLSKSIQLGLNTVIDGLEVDLRLESIEPDKLKAAMESKLVSFKMAKELLLDWVNSPNAPSRERFDAYISKIISLGERNLKTLSEALATKIDYHEIEPHKHKAIAQSKVTILKFIRELDGALVELREQHSSGTVNLKEYDFSRGMAEKFAHGEFFAASNYHKKVINEDNGAVILDPKGTLGNTMDLQGLLVQLPRVPRDRTKILYHDLPKEEQYWRREPIPQSLNPDTLNQHMEWVLEQFRRRREGVWFYNNGKPVWLTPWHWMQLQYGKMLSGGIYPNYRECQRDLAYHKYACWLDPNSMGQIFLKSRQTGYTYGILSDSINTVTSIPNSRNGLTSMTDEDARLAWDKMSYTFLEWPFFFQPIVQGRVDSPNKLYFTRPGDSSHESKKKRDTTTDGYLNSLTDYLPNKEKAYDGQTLTMYVGDESGKKGKVDIIEHFNVLLPTSFRGGRVTGKIYLGSTMGKLAEGGEGFRVLYYASNPQERQASGYTSTKLYKYFMPAHTNYEDCIDKYGKCWQVTPPKGTLNTFGEPITKGSVESIHQLYDDARRQGDSALNAAYRAFPMTEEHAMRDESEACVFNLNKLSEQWDYNLENADTQYTMGNFEWRDGERFSSVVFIPDNRGKFKVAWLPSKQSETNGLKNNSEFWRHSYRPLNDYGVIGVDCFGSYSVGKNKMSKGAAHLYIGENLVGAPAHTFAFEYLHRPPTQDIFNEDILKAAWFYGIPILAENNRRDFVRFLYDNQCRGFSMSRVDKPERLLSGDDATLGGQPMNSKDVLDMHENGIRTYIQKRVGVADDPISQEVREEGSMGFMPFTRTLEDWMRFDPAKRTPFDATISSGLAIMGVQRRATYKKEKPNNPKKNSSLIRRYRNNGQVSSLIAGAKK